MLSIHALNTFLKGFKLLCHSDITETLLLTFSIHETSSYGKVFAGNILGTINSLRILYVNFV